MTPQDAAAEALKSLLKDTGNVRSSAIALSGFDYADNLAKAIKDRVTKIESFYADCQKKLKGCPSPKELTTASKKDR